MLLLAMAAGELAACGLPSAGPTVSEMTAATKSGKNGGAQFALIDVDSAVVEKMSYWDTTSMKGTFGQQVPVSAQVIGVGDVIQIVVWEAATGGLFSPTGDRANPGSRSTVIPEQAVGPDGAVTVPFAGRVRVAGRSPQQVEGTIVTALTGKAVEPQVLVTVTKNIANTVTVVGEVTGGARIPLTTRGDRIPDVVAQAGGIKAPAHEIFVTLVRNGLSARIPMQAILSTPAENIYVMPGDVISIAREPQTFTAAGATGQNSIVPFDAIGITLDQAIARSGGLNDNRADATGVYVIRYEQATDYDQLGYRRPDAMSLAQIPVVYRINMREPNGFFLARRFPVHNKDILFVSNAPMAEVQKVMNVLIPVIGTGGTAAVVTSTVAR